MSENEAEIFRKVFIWCLNNSFEISCRNETPIYGIERIVVTMTRRPYVVSFSLSCADLDWHYEYLAEEIKDKLSRAVNNFLLKEIEL